MLGITTKEKTELIDEGHQAQGDRVGHQHRLPTPPSSHPVNHSGRPGPNVLTPQVPLQIVGQFSSRVIAVAGVLLETFQTDVFQFT